MTSWGDHATQICYKHFTEKKVFPILNFTRITFLLKHEDGLYRDKYYDIILGLPIFWWIIIIKILLSN